MIHHRRNSLSKPIKDQNAWRKWNLQILRNIGNRHHETSGDKRKNSKRVSRRMRKLLEIKLHWRNLVKGINAWAVPLERYSGPFLKWTREELQQMDQRIKKVMRKHKALHPRHNVDRLYMSRKEGGRGLASIGDSIKASIQRLKDNIRKCRRLITAIRNNKDHTSMNKENQKTKMGIKTTAWTF